MRTAAPTVFDILPPVRNADEEAAPRVTDLVALGFPGEDAWAPQDLCGGAGCSAPVRGQAARRPF